MVPGRISGKLAKTSRRNQRVGGSGLPDDVNEARIWIGAVDRACARRVTDQFKVLLYPYRQVDMLDLAFNPTALATSLPRGHMEPNSVERFL
jgi:hypothetical protein